jgi:hypothetical protein
MERLCRSLRVAEGDAGGSGQFEVEPPALLAAHAAAPQPPPLSLDDDDEEEEGELSPLASDFLFDPPEYASEYHPLPRRMKLPEVISREADSPLQLGQVLMASSVMR